MMYVPAGEFRMGSNDDYDIDEKPAHTVFLDTYWLDQTEVTNSMYSKCVDTGKCNPPASNESSTRDNYFGNSLYGDFPVIHVFWYDAQTYCEWRGSRLPTEAEWEKAAGWDDDKKEQRVYPWGDTINCSLANYWNRKGGGYCVGDTTKVGSYPSGVSFYGLMDMAGNVWEWVADLYGSNYYFTSPSSNPTGLSSGSAERVLRGGSWYFTENNLRSSNRTSFTVSSFQVGFRCARDATP